MNACAPPEPSLSFRTRVGERASFAGLALSASGLIGALVVLGCAARWGAGGMWGAWGAIAAGGALVVGSAAMPFVAFFVGRDWLGPRLRRRSVARKARRAREVPYR